MTVCKHCSIDSATLRWQAERIEELEAELQAAEDIRRAQSQTVKVGTYKLSPAEAAIVSLLLTNDRVSRDQLLSCYTSRQERDMVSHSLLNVTMYHIRKKLKPLGLTIEAIWGYGYRIPREQHERIKAELAA